MVLARSEEWQRILSWLHFQTLKQRNATGVTNRAICRVNSSVSPVGSIKPHEFVARNTGARPKWRVCAEKYAVFSLPSGMRAGSPALSELIIGRKHGLVRRIGHLKSYRCASKNPGAHMRIESARPKHVVCRRRESVPACWPCTIPTSAERMACPIGHIRCSRFGSRNRGVP